MTTRLLCHGSSQALLQAYQAWRNGAATVYTTAEQPSKAAVEPPSDIKADLARIEAKLDLIIKKLGI